jgi:hypothetical protein
MKTGYSFWTTIIIAAGMIASIATESVNFLGLSICIGVFFNFILGNNPLKEDA